MIHNLFFNITPFSPMLLFRGRTQKKRLIGIHLYLFQYHSPFPASNPSEPSKFLESSNPNGSARGGEPKKGELRVYCRRPHVPQQFQPQELESTPVEDTQSQEPESNPVEEYQSEEDNCIFDGLDVPIALRNGVRSCTQHPVSGYSHTQNYPHNSGPSLQPLTSQRTF